MGNPCFDHWNGHGVIGMDPCPRAAYLPVGTDRNMRTAGTYEN